MHYRCAMVLGTCTRARAATTKLAALERITEHLMPGRWADARQPNRKELAATLVLSLPLDEWSVKVSDGPPDDAEDDLDLPVWAGVVPLRETYGDAGAGAGPAAGLDRARRTSGTGPDGDDSAPAYRSLSLWRDTADDDWAPRRAAARRPRRRRGHRRRRLHRAVDRLLPGASATRRCASSSSRRRSPASARAGATAAGARRCSPRRWPGWPRRYGARRRGRAAPRDVGDGRRGRPGRRRRGHRLPLGQGRHRRRWRARRVQLERARAEVDEARRVGLRPRTTCRCSTRRRPRERLGATDVLGGDVHAALRRDPPGPAGARAGPGGRAPRRARSTSARR